MSNEQEYRELRAVAVLDDADEPDDFTAHRTRPDHVN